MYQHIQNNLVEIIYTYKLLLTSSFFSNTFNVFFHNKKTFVIHLHNHIIESLIFFRYFWVNQTHNKVTF